MHVLHRLPSGDAVKLSGDSDLTLPCTSFSTWKFGERNQEIGSGKLAFAEGFVRGLGVQHFDEEYSFEGGTLRLGSDIVSNTVTQVAAVRRWLVWEGENTSLYTYRVGANSSEMISIMSSFDLEETPAGIILRPKDPRRNPIIRSRLAVYKGIEGIAFFDIEELSPDHRQALPPWRGKRVRGGELFSMGHAELTDGSHQELLALVTPTAFVNVEAELGVDEDDLMGVLSDITVAWQPTA